MKAGGEGAATGGGGVGEAGGDGGGLRGKRLLFLVKNIRNQRYGLLSLAASLKQAGHWPEYVQVDGSDGVERVLARIASFRPDVLGVTAMTGEMNFLLGILGRVREVWPGLFTILGGPHATFVPGIVAHPLIDAICRGEGDEALVAFLDRYPGGDWREVANIGYCDGGRVVLNPLRPMVDLESLPIPDFDFIPRSTPDKFVVFASRNCVYSCHYCFNAQYRELYREAGEGNVYRMKSVERFLRELKHLKENYTFDYFYFMDDVFPTRGDWIDEFTRRYPVEVGVPFHVSFNPVLVREEVIEKLCGAGLFSMNMAIESGNPRIRRLMNRPRMSNDHLIRISRILKKHRVYINTQNIIMSPTETLEEAKETLELNIACGVDSGVVGKFQPYPGTAMARTALELGLISEADLERIPEDYHFESLLKFPEELAVRMDNLLHAFSFCIRYPFMKPLVYRLLSCRCDWLFHRLDDQFWMTHTHRPKKELVGGGFWAELRVTGLFVWRMFFPRDKAKFVH
ncbi:MAG: B12-binding domain-containing radical SAM protein [Magnetococcales bacterium]|nr:B12-binding domain-containing radical SAM protein [Magnetococcales bacterium]